MAHRWQVLSLPEFLARTGGDSDGDGSHASSGAGPAAGSLVQAEPELACDVVLDAVGAGVAVQSASLRVLRRRGHYCDLNGDFIRSVDAAGECAPVPRQPHPHLS